MPRKAAAAPPKTLPDVAATGDLRASLEALRDLLAIELAEGARCKECGGGVSSPTAALAKQFAEVVKSIDALPAKEASGVDDLAARRAARIAAAKGADGSSRGQQRRPRSG